MFSCEYYKISKNTYFEKHLPMAAPVIKWNYCFISFVIHFILIGFEMRLKYHHLLSLFFYSLANWIQFFTLSQVMVNLSIVIRNEKIFLSYAMVWLWFDYEFRRDEIHATFFKFLKFVKMPSVNTFYLKNFQYLYWLILIWLTKKCLGAVSKSLF